MTKKLLILGAFCSLSFAGISDDIKLEKEQQARESEVKQYKESQRIECDRIQFKDFSDKYTLSELETLYDNALKINDDIANLNEKYAKKMAEFRLLYKFSKNSDVFAYNEDGTPREEYPICYEVHDVERYKESIKQAYLKLKKEKEKASAEIEIKKIIKDELYEHGLNEYSIEQYDDFLAKAKDVWARIRKLNKGDTLSMPTYFYYFNTEERYIEELQKQKQAKIERMARDRKNSQSTKALIPKYKKWKTTTVPKFQKSLKAGDYVVGGIVWKVNGNLVVIDAGRDGLKSQQRNQTLPRVPQDLMPLFMDEITGRATY